MAKQTDATVYYCDKCRKTVVGTPAIIRDGESVAVARGIDPEFYTEIDKIPFHSTKINKFIVPELSAVPGQQSLDGTVDIRLEVEGRIKYLCDECAEDIADDYVTWCGTIAELFTK